MSAFLRRIDLTTKLLAPIITGLIFTYGSIIMGGLFIIGWNLVSLIVEYGVLTAIYRSVPDLANRNVEGKEGEAFVRALFALYSLGRLRESAIRSISL